MKKEFNVTLILAILLTMPIHFLVAIAMVLRGKFPWSKEKQIPITKVYKKKKPRYKKPLFNETEISYT